jgi:hypothetical protein
MNEFGKCPARAVAGLPGLTRAALGGAGYE